jgi:hypothetical protein
MKMKLKRVNVEVNEEEYLELKKILIDKKKTFSTFIREHITKEVKNSKK